MNTYLRAHVYILFLLEILFCFPHLSFSQSRVIAQEMFFLRRGNTPEWSTFPKVTNSQLVLPFSSQPNLTEYTLSCRQEDVKQDWRILLNDKELGRLHRDENPMIGYWPVPAQLLQQGSNILKIVQKDTLIDDIGIGEIRLHDRPMQSLLSQAQMHIRVIDKHTGVLLPCRLTITSSNQALQTVGTMADESLAIRPGFVYTATGKASLGLPQGSYTIYATRGVEYGVDSLQVNLKSGDSIEKTLTLLREVPTEGWVSADSHIHTFTYSGHGDASLAERAITIAGEGIELPIFTDHNVQVDIDSLAKALKVRPYFTPLIGNEVTTKVGHFNVFPLAVDMPPIDPQVENWQELEKNLSIQQQSNKANGRVVILNHAQDIHQGFRPFGEDRHISSAGMSLDQWKLPANAMEIINSGSQQNEKLRLFHDWLAMLNRGQFLTPIGASDSHDVGRYLVGQARTYIQCKDDHPGNIEANTAVANLLKGKVMVSFGLLTHLQVNQLYGAGDLVKADNEVEVTVTVLGPAWLRASRVSLYANGTKVKEQVISDTGKGGIKWTAKWKLLLSKHDVHLVAMAEGAGHYRPFWPIAKPYQPSSSVWQPGIMGCSGAVWIDADGDGKKTSAYAYAQQVMAASKGDINIVLEKLSAYDEAVTIQTASLLQQQGVELADPMISKTVKKAPKAVQQGFEKFGQAWKRSQQVKKSK